MAVRQIYSCDWCCIDAKALGIMDSDWELVTDPVSREKVHLCAACLKAFREAWERARQIRFKETHPQRVLLED
jgi:hypothetical protein